LKSLIRRDESHIGRSCSQDRRHHSRAVRLRVAPWNQLAMAIVPARWTPTARAVVCFPLCAYRAGSGLAGESLSQARNDLLLVLVGLNFFSLRLRRLRSSVRHLGVTESEPTLGEGTEARTPSDKPKIRGNHRRIGR